MAGIFSNGFKVNAMRILGVLFVLITTSVIASAYDVNEKLTIEGTLTGVYQYGDYDVKGMDNKNRGAAVFDLGMNFHPSESDEFQVTLGFAAGNGLNGLNPLSLTPYADDLEDDLKNINGRDRDYLLEAWYKHTFKLNGDTSLAVTGGIIDSTAFIDDNAFANDETGQFMNEVFVNHRNVNLPSYDLGGAVEFNVSNVTIRGVIMNTKHEAGDDQFANYNYYALQLGYALETSLGKGNYRIYGFTTSKRFEDWDEAGKERLKGIGISLDQELSSVVGVFARAGWQDDAAVIDHETAYSGGVNINGKLWGRENDAIGIGYAYLIGADDSDIDNTNAIESYIKFQISKFNDVSLDIQYVDDNMRHDDDRKGFIYGLRANAYF
jgi:hypothetical protein